MPRSFLLAGVGVVGIVALAGCSTDSSVQTTPTFSAARYVPTVQPQLSIPGTGLPPVSGPAPEPTREYRGLSGVAAISAANRQSTVDPDDGSMRGATWYIENVDSSLIYRVCTATGRATTILLPPGERFNGAVGGNVDAFLINVTYAGPRPAVSILPRMGGARGNLQLVTTGGFYSYALGPCQTALNLMDVARRDSPPHAASVAPQPEGDFTRLTLVREDDKPAPAWAPAEAWADSRKMVVRFDGPLPVLPTLLAGQKGEQVVSYHSVKDGREVYLITDRRVTEAELRLGSEGVRLTVDPAAVSSGTAADPAQGADAWKPAAGTLDPPPAQPYPADTPKRPMPVNPPLGVPSAPTPVRL